MNAVVTLEELLERIHNADEKEINPIISAITEHFTEVWPEWELMTLSIQGHDRESHIKALQDSIAVLSSGK